MQDLYVEQSEPDGAAQKKTVGGCWWENALWFYFDLLLIESSGSENSQKQFLFVGQMQEFWKILNRCSSAHGHTDSFTSTNIQTSVTKELVLENPHCFGQFHRLCCSFQNRANGSTGSHLNGFRDEWIYSRQKNSAVDGDIYPSGPFKHYSAQLVNKRHRRGCRCVWVFSSGAVVLSENRTTDPSCKEYVTIVKTKSFV